jgi:hypothetical protein
MVIGSYCNGHVRDLAGRLFRLISRYAVNLFFSDQWGFNRATLFERHSLWEMFRWQHGPHRQGAGALVSYFLEPHFSWSSRTESFLIGGLIVTNALLVRGVTSQPIRIRNWSTCCHSLSRARSAPISKFPVAQSIAFEIWHQS